MRYGKLISATDQDDDGKGNIFGLIMNFIGLFWPNLIKRNYLTRINTPIVRAFPKFKGTKKHPAVIKEFHFNSDYDLWRKGQFKNHDEMSKKYRIQFFKGLGAHKKHYIKHMFKDINEKLTTVDFDEDAAKHMDIFYGKTTTSRKEVLSTPVAESYVD